MPITIKKKLKTVYKLFDLQSMNLNEQWQSTTTYTLLQSAIRLSTLVNTFLKSMLKTSMYKPKVFGDIRRNGIELTSLRRNCCDTLLNEKKSDWGEKNENK